MKRRNFLSTIAIAPFVSVKGIRPGAHFNSSGGFQGIDNRLKISLNAYSFNEPLLNGSLNLDNLLDFCADQGFYAVDIPGYYFIGYPEVPSDEYIYHIKRKAYKNGIDISGIGVRNDFTFDDEGKRKEDKLLVKKWIDVGSKLGAPVIRIFAGNQDIQKYTWEQVAKWVVSDMVECTEYGKNRGVIVAVQNHFDFIKTADQTLKIIEMVNSEWFGLILDVGSFRMGDPYAEISKTVNYAVNWQIKEDVYINQKSEKIDLVKLFKIIKASKYRGYLPLETLGEGDPFVKVPIFLKQARKALEES